MSDYIITGKAVERWDIPQAILVGEIVRCRDCRFAYPLFDEEGDEIQNLFDCHGKLTTSWDFYNDEPQDNPVEPDGFCKWGERRSE